MIIVNNEEQFKSLSLIRLYDDGLREERIMTVRGGAFSPRTAEKAIILNANRSEREFKLYFVVQSTDGSRQLLVLSLRNPYIFHGHFTVLKMSFEGSVHEHRGKKRRSVTLKLTKSFLTEKEPLDDSMMSIEPIEQTRDTMSQISNIYANCFADISETISWNCLMLDTSMSNPKDFQRGRSRLMERYFVHRDNGGVDQFFSVVTFGTDSEKLERLGDRFITNSRTPVEQVISTIHQGISTAQRNPFKPILPLFEEVRHFTDLYNIDLKINLNVIMITDGVSLSPSMLSGFCGKRDELGIKVYCIGGSEDSHVLDTIVNCAEFDQLE